MKQKIIQLILILRLRAGTILIQVREGAENNRDESSALAADLNQTYGMMQGLLWVLREMEPGRFHTVIETIGFRSYDAEIKQLNKLDELVHKYGPLAGEYAASSVKTREREDGQ